MADPNDDMKDQTYIRRPSEYHPMADRDGDSLDKGYSPHLNTPAGEHLVSKSLKSHGFDKAADKLDKSGESARRRDTSSEGP